VAAGAVTISTRQIGIAADAWARAILSSPYVANWQTVLFIDEDTKAGAELSPPLPKFVILAALQSRTSEAQGR
jgi:hypothetical protein